MKLEVEFGEKPLVLAGPVFFFQSLLDKRLGFLFLRGLNQGLVGDGALEGLNVQGVSGWHQVVVVDQLDEWLDGNSLGNLLRAVGLADPLWALLDADNDSVWEGVRLGAVVIWLDNHDLLTSETTTRNDSCVLVGDVRGSATLRTES